MLCGVLGHLHDVCLQNLHVVFGIDRAGLVGEDGETHQGVFDLSFLSHIPNLTILAPSCYDELKAMLSFALHEHKGPVAIRYPKGAVPFREAAPFLPGQAELLRQGNQITMVAEGRMVETALQVCNILSQTGITATLYNIRTIKPFDIYPVQQSLAQTRFLVTIEDNIKWGGMGQMLRASLQGNYQFIPFGFGDQFIPQGKPGQLFERYGLDANHIASQIIKEYHT